jgi:hypothetical protein
LEHWQYSLEGAYQFGHKQDPMVKNPVNLGTQWRSIDAFGAKGKLTYLLKDKANNQFSLVGEVLSGDDPNTGKDEMFAYTDTKQAPWFVVNADDKECARLNCITHLLNMIPYEDVNPEEIILPPRQKENGYG